MCYPIKDKLQIGNLQMELNKVKNFIEPGVKFKLLNGHQICFASN